MSKLEDKILVREIGRLAGFFSGFGARLAARHLPVEEWVVIRGIAKEGIVKQNSALKAVERVRALLLDTGA